MKQGDEDQLHGVPVGQWIMIAVRDTGIGMTPDVLTRAFEPFYTTKPVGKGTGLGLAMVYGTVAQHNGHVWVESAHGHGTAVRLFLPPAPDGTPVEQLAETRGGSTPSLGRALLLVEDEKAVRAVVSRILSEHGYEVITAEDGQYALDRCDDALLARLSLVVSDVVMPRVGGVELVTELRKRRADLPVLFVSGYRENDRVLEMPNTGFLEKPFTPGVLLEAVQGELDAASRRSGDRTHV